MKEVLGEVVTVGVWHVYPRTFSKCPLGIVKGLVCGMREVWCCLRARRVWFVWV